MMAQVIVVAPIEGGWLVQRGSAEPWTFGSRAQAEWSARRLADALAEGGQSVEIRLYGERGDLACRALRPAAQAFAPAAPERQPEPV